MTKGTDNSYIDELTLTLIDGILNKLSTWQSFSIKAILNGIDATEYNLIMPDKHLPKSIIAQFDEKRVDLIEGYLEHGRFATSVGGDGLGFRFLKLTDKGKFLKRFGSIAKYEAYEIAKEEKATKLLDVELKGKEYAYKYRSIPFWASGVAAIMSIVAVVVSIATCNKQSIQQQGQLSQIRSMYKISPTTKKKISDASLRLQKDSVIAFSQK